MAPRMNAHDPNRYDKATAERQKHVDAILESTARKKVVVAGPGTGKTYLFKKVLEGKENTLTLTFVNALVEDLSLELCGLSDVKTLHGFARSALGAQKQDEVKVFPKLSTVIAQDAKLLLNHTINFDQIFHTRDDGNEHVAFYKRRKDYYGYYGYADIVFAIVKHFETKGEAVPEYEQLVVDEFQDFNKLEVSLIELLAEKSPVLLAGDDDQALYDFKAASPEHIRHRHGNQDLGYVGFTLPYCSRCTRPIVGAVNDIIKNALSQGRFAGRVPKQYEYFDDPKKDRDSDANPKLIHAQLFSKQIPWFIDQQLGEIAKELKSIFSVLIISPTKVQSRDIVVALKKKGFSRIESVEPRGSDEPTLLDGLKLLLEDDKCNLGWRIALKHILNENDFISLLKNTHSNDPLQLADLAEKEARRTIRDAVSLLKAVRDDKRLSTEERGRLFRVANVNAGDIAMQTLRDELFATAQRIGNASTRKLPITATTIQSSKGLAADYVFITHFDDQYFIRGKDKAAIADQDVCNFLVALTRAKKKVYLISSSKKSDPTFLKWIAGERVEQITFARKGG